MGQQNQIQGGSGLGQFHGGSQGQVNANSGVNYLNFNSVLVYNIAAMSYQTQQFGQCLGYLNLLLKYFDLTEAFLQVKTLFLLLQTLYELRQSEPA